MEIVLTKELEDFVKAKVAEGRYLDESEVVREAIRHFEDREIERRLEQRQPAGPGTGGTK